MRNNQPNIKLLFQNKEKEIHFFPNNFEQLREYFLSINGLKSSGNYKFKIYPSKEENKTYDQEGGNFSEFINKIRQLKTPTIIIYDESEEYDMEELDEKYIHYLEEHDRFDKKLYRIKTSELQNEINQNPYNDDFNKLYENMLKNLENLSKYENRINNLDSNIQSISYFSKNELAKDLNEAK